MNYSEGTCFAIPLRDGGFALGLVARMDGKGSVFGYFFGPKVNNITELRIAEGLTPNDAILIGNFGDLGLLRGEWPVIGQMSQWSRETWPMPLFISEGQNDKEAVLAKYNEDTFELSTTRRVNRRDVDERTVLPDRLMGYGAAEIRLTQLLSREATSK